MDGEAEVATLYLLRAVQSHGLGARLLRDTARTLHVLNAPSPAATSALPIASMIVDRIAALRH